MISGYAFQIVNVQIEGGGKVHDRGADDPGGVTNWGFAQRYNPDVDVRTLDEWGAKARAFLHYWEPMGCDQYSPGKALVVYDCAFQHGVPTAAIWLQQTVGAVCDGHVGANTVRAVRNTDVGDLILGMHRQRRIKYLSRNDRVEESNEGGWVDRLMRIAVEAMRFDLGGKGDRILSGAVGE